MKTFRAFGPTLGKGRLSKKIIKTINNFVDNTIISKKNDYSSKLASQIKNEIKLSNLLIKKTLSRELISPAPPDLLTSRPLLKVRSPNSNLVSSDLLVASRCSASWMISPCLRLMTGEIRKPLKSSDS